MEKDCTPMRLDRVAGGSPQPATQTLCATLVRWLPDIKRIGSHTGCGAHRYPLAVVDSPAVRKTAR